MPKDNEMQTLFAPTVRGRRPRDIRVMIADGQVLVGAGLRALLESEGDIVVVAEAAHGTQAISLAAEMRPEVVVVDIGLPGLGAVEFTRRIRVETDLARPSVMILATQADDEHLFAALCAGATGILLMDTDPTELVQAVRVVAAGDVLLSQGIARRLVAEVASQPAPDRPTPEQFEDLTAREREVVALVATGLSNQQIAERLVVSPATAKTHVSRAIYKVHARDRAQLVALAYEAGLVIPRRSRAARGRENMPRVTALVA
jgi:DNA-binding NarL/FixJ family response regulator